MSDVVAKIHVNSIVYYFSANKGNSTILIERTPNISRQNPNVIHYSSGYLEAQIRELLQN